MTKSAIHTVGDRLPVVIKQADAAYGDSRRHGIVKLNEIEEQRVVFLARPPDVEVHVVERVHRADDVACLQARPRFARMSTRRPVSSRVATKCASFFTRPRVSRPARMCT